MEEYQLCAARIGLSKARWPFAKIEVSENQLKIPLLGFSYVFQNDETLQLKVRRRFLFKVLKVEHENLFYPKTVIIWPCNLQELIDYLEEMNYRIS